uniref:Uncharacterized protein n=1 Tax=Lactuca sativa TaxID=4236 RepID=A0A9R1XP13_LACSA|nr:hypothetical protein LSAT_V11C300140310 [Lactuca sativa]
METFYVLLNIQSYFVFTNYCVPECTDLDQRMKLINGHDLKNNKIIESEGKRLQNYLEEQYHSLGTDPRRWLIEPTVEGEEE